MITYKTASVDDLVWIIDFKKKMLVESGLRELLSDEFEAIVLADYQRMYLAGDAQHFVAEIDGRPVATAGAFLKSDIPYRYFKPGIYGFLGDVYTDKQQRGNGLASQLTDSSISWLKARGVTYVKLLASDMGRPIYEKRGFTKTVDMELRL